MVGGGEQDEALGIALLHLPGGRNGGAGGCVAAKRLQDQQGRRLDGLQLQAGLLGVGAIADDHGRTERSVRSLANPQHGSLQKGVLADQPMQLLGAGCPRRRPQPGARATGQDDGRDDSQWNSLSDRAARGGSARISMGATGLSTPGCRSGGCACCPRLFHRRRIGGLAHQTLHGRLQQGGGDGLGDMGVGAVSQRRFG